MLQLFDYLKAVIAAVSISVLNIAASFVVVAIYAHFINPGREHAFYQDAAKWLAPWSSVFVGFVLFFAACYWISSLRPDRSAYAMAAAIFVVYALLDLGILIASGELKKVAAIAALSLSTKLAAAFLGAWLATK